MRFGRNPGNWDICTDSPVAIAYLDTVTVHAEVNRYRHLRLAIPVLWGSARPTARAAANSTDGDVKLGVYTTDDKYGIASILLSLRGAGFRYWSSPVDVLRLWVNATAAVARASLVGPP